MQKKNYLQVSPLYYNPRERVRWKSSPEKKGKMFCTVVPEERESEREGEREYLEKRPGYAAVLIPFVYIVILKF